MAKVEDYYLSNDIDIPAERDFIKFLNEQQKDEEMQGINLYINSFGGNAYSGIGIADAILASKIPINTVCLGTAESMAFLIFVSGSYRKCYPHSTFMYHPLSQGDIDDSPIPHIATKIKEDMRLQKIIDGILIDRTALTAQKLDTVKKTNSVWYIPAKEALKLRIVDKIIE